MKFAEWLIDGYKVKKINSFKDFLFSLMIVPRLLFALIPVVSVFWGFVAMMEAVHPKAVFPFYLISELYIIYFWYFKDFEEGS